ncbi:recombinase RecA [Meiothermus granaticius]|uniref:Protein RecA n=1 Tax=Meiothermus granaticius NBRC 107808 TaxID=1227551 RepID=A0A399F4N8_9DEIN|nr:recombinase RecA [Meiothermus granaticius]MCL6528068.1 recombinase RecA [Thermaceae bacterium]RIH91020.1 Protein RecA [Meiothermus granaticius NBRC 107808]GEM88319.1 protein RecA [Meiothermus granaticius NBRC 107808]
MDKEKQKALDGALKSIEKQFGKGAVMRLGEAPRQQVEVISTGSLGLDMALGIGGIPRGRIIEVYGPESGGKTTLCLGIVAQAQMAGGVAAYVDAEHALDPNYAKSLGVNIDELLISQPDTGEQALEIVELLTRSGAVDVIVVDSVAALVPQAEIEGQMGDAFVGLQARMMSQAMRKLTAALSKSNTTAIFINQIREKVGVMYGNPETTTGGRALKFYASVRLEVRRQGQPIKVGNHAVGNRIRIKVTKNKMAPPFREAEIELYFGKGIDPMTDLVSVAIAAEVIEKSGSWLSYGATRLGQGKEKAAEYLKGDPVMAQEIREKVLAQAGKLPLVVEGGEEEEAPVAAAAEA